MAKSGSPAAGTSSIPCASSSRVVDGAVAHQFMRKLKETLEGWSEGVL